jgi:integrase/recombinase XerD
LAYSDKLIKTSVKGLFKIQESEKYYISKMINYKHVRKKINTKNFQVAKQKFYEEINKSENRSKPDTITLYDAIDKYLDWALNSRGMEERSYYSKKIIMNFLTNYFHDLPLKEFNVDMYSDYLNHRRTMPNITKTGVLSNYTLNVDLRNHKAFFNWCTQFPDIGNPYLKVSPIKRVPNFKIKRKTRKSVDRKLVNQFLDFIKEQNYRIYEFCYIQFTLGLRQIELLRLSFKDFEMEKGYVYIDNSRKNENYRFVPIPVSTQLIIDNLKRYPKKFTYQHPKNNKIINIDNTNNLLFPEIRQRYLLYRIKKYADLFEKSIDVEFKLRSHGFRHSYGSILLEDNVDENYIKELYGHNNIETTRLYLNIQNDRKKDLVNKTFK